jgi:hypothetical protein
MQARVMKAARSCALDVLVESAGLVLLNPDADQIAASASSVSPTSGVSTRLVGEIDGKIAIIAETRDSKPDI